MDHQRDRPRAATRTSSFAPPPTSQILSAVAITSSSWLRLVRLPHVFVKQRVLTHTTTVVNNDGTPNKHNHRYSCSKSMEAVKAHEPWVRPRSRKVGFAVS